MKKVCLLLPVLFSFQAFAQLSINGVYIKSSKKNITGDTETKTNFVKAYSNNLPAAVVTDFMEKYPDAQDVSWYINDKKVTGYFKYKEKDITVHYKKDGLLLSTRKVYDGSGLSPRVSQYVEDEAGGEYQVDQVTESIRNDLTLYEVTLVAPGKLCIIQVCRNHEDEGLSVLEKKVMRRS